MFDTLARPLHRFWAEVAGFFDEADDLFLDDPLLAPLDPVLPAGGFPTIEAGLHSAA